MERILALMPSGVDNLTTALYFALKDRNFHISNPMDSYELISLLKDVDDFDVFYNDVVDYMITYKVVEYHLKLSLLKPHSDYSSLKEWLDMKKSRSLKELFIKSVSFAVFKDADVINDEEYNYFRDLVLGNSVQDIWSTLEEIFNGKEKFALYNGLALVEVFDNGESH